MTLGEFGLRIRYACLSGLLEMAAVSNGSIDSFVRADDRKDYACNSCHYTWKSKGSSQCPRCKSADIDEV